MTLSVRPFALLLCALVACAPEPPAPSPLEGLWLGTEPTPGWTLNVAGESFFIQGPDSEIWYRGRFELEPGGEAGTVDLEIEECDCDERGSLARARYRLTRPPDRSSELVFASRQPGKGERPPDLEPARDVLLLYFLQSP